MSISSRDLFNIPDDVTYLNCAYMGPQLKSVSDAGVTGLNRKEQPWEVLPGDFFDICEEARALFAQIIGASPENIAITNAASYGITTAAMNIPVQKGSRMLMFEEQFPSNVYAWRKLAAEKGAHLEIIERREGSDDLTPLILDALGSGAALLSLPHCHWTDGALIDMEAVGERCVQLGVPLVIDGTQSIGALPFDVKKVKPAFLTAATYKWLLGPYTLAFMYVDDAYLDGIPVEENWVNRANSQDFASLVNYRDEYRPGARRYDMGERSNFISLPMASKAMRQILEWSVTGIAETTRSLTALAAKLALQHGLDVPKPEFRSPHIIGIRFPDGVPPSLKPELARQNIHVSVRGNAVRISPHVYNSEVDVHRLFDVMIPLLNG